MPASAGEGELSFYLFISKEFVIFFSNSKSPLPFSLLSYSLNLVTYLEIGNKILVMNFAKLFPPYFCVKYKIVRIIF